MSKINNAVKRLEVTKGIKDGKTGVDREYEDEKFKGVIRGFAVMTKGKVKDSRQYVIDDKTIDQVMESGQSVKSGLKSRFGHPNASSSALGTYVGRAKNFTRDGDIVRADLFISKTAHATPDGDLAKYVMDLAENDPDAFGTSVVIGQMELESLYEEGGKPKKNEDGSDQRALRVFSLLAVDVVDDPAANNGMFGKVFFSKSVELSAGATTLLDKLISSPEALDYMISFLERYKSNRDDIDEPKKTKKQEAKAMDSLKELTAEQLSKERPDLVKALQDQGRTEGRDTERTRALSIVKSAQTEFKGMGMEEVLESAISKGDSHEAALSAMRGKRLNDLQAGASPNPGGDNLDKKVAAGTAKKMTPEQRLSKAKEYQAQHKCSMEAALKAV